jgi:hypothetical protein
VRGLLGAVEEADWSVGAPDLDMTVAGVVAHAAEVCLWYAIDLAAGSEDRIGAGGIHHLGGGEGQRSGGCPSQV